MDESTSLLDNLLSIAEASIEEDTSAKKKSKNISLINEDEHFIDKISEFTKYKSSSKKISKLGNQTSAKKVEAKINLSTVHSGDTDSSDDELNRDYQNAKYNECGQNIKHLLFDQKSSSESEGVSSTWKPKRHAPQSSLNLTQKPAVLSKLKDISDMYTDPFFGIRISKPLISSLVLQERMMGRSAVSMAKVKQFSSMENNSQDWVISGVIVIKSAVKTSQKGSQYIIWTLSDLKDDLKTVAMFLFGNAYKQLWKTAVGTVVGVLNPSLMDQREGSKDQVTLSVDTAQKVMVFGQSKDYGICKSKKKDGEQCNSFVNTAKCEYCVYHIRQEYQKLSKRSELQSSFAGRGLTALRNKVLGKNEVFYAGKSYMAIPAKKNQKQLQRDTSLLKSLSELSKSGVITTNGSVSTNCRTKVSAQSLEISRSQRLKDLELLNKLKGSTSLQNNSKKELTNTNIIESFEKSKEMYENDIESSDETKLEVQTEKLIKTNILEETTLLNSQRNANENSAKSCNLRKFKSVKNEINHLQTSSSQMHMRKNTDDISHDEITRKKSKENLRLYSDEVKECVTARGNILKSMSSLGTPRLSSSSSIDLNSPVSKSSHLRIDRAKLNALKYIQKHGPLKKPNTEPTKKLGVKRFLEDSDIMPSKAPKMADEKFISQRFKQMMALTSKHTDLLEQEDRGKEEVYFKKLEIKEKMEEKMTTVFKINCKAVRCLTCKYTSFSAADRCKEERHVLKVFDAVKRFFKCSKCGNRTVSLEVIPLLSCKQCGGSKWERTTMMKEKTVHIGEKLSIRGDEEKFVGAINSGANINLLVPDE